MKIKDILLEVYFSWKFMPLFLKFVSFVVGGFGTFGTIALLLMIVMPSGVFEVNGIPLTRSQTWSMGYGLHFGVVVLVCAFTFYGLIKRMNYSRYLLSFIMFIFVPLDYIDYINGITDNLAENLYGSMLTAIIWLVVLSLYLFRKPSCQAYFVLEKGSG